MNDDCDGDDGDSDGSVPASDPWLDAGSIARTPSPAGRQPVHCPRCDEPIALVVSYGPLTHEASPCGCRVSRDVLEGVRDRSD